MWSRDYGLGLESEECGLGVVPGLELCSLVLAPSLVFHSWREKFETYWLKNVKFYLLLHALFKNAMHYLSCLLCSYFCC